MTVYLEKPKKFIKSLFIFINNLSSLLMHDKHAKIDNIPVYQ